MPRDDNVKVTVIRLCHLTERLIDYRKRASRPARPSRAIARRCFPKENRKEKVKNRVANEGLMNWILR